jgi:molecular chaperone GrpE
MSSKKEKAHRPESEAQGSSEDVPESFEDQSSEPEESVPVLEQLQEELVESKSRMEILEQQLIEAQAQSVEYKDGWQRTLADFQNYKRRVDGESAETYQNAVRNIIRRYLPVLDDMERALAHRPTDLPWVDGIDLIYRKLKSILEAEGVQRIEAEGQPFDPNFHEAVSQEPVEGVESGTVIGVIQQGYMLGERVIRPAQVRVSQ